LFFSAALSHALSLDASGNFMNYVKIIKMLLKLHGENNKTKKNVTRKQPQSERKY